jgi:hypothetical protein
VAAGLAHLELSPNGNTTVEFSDREGLNSLFLLTSNKPWSRQC